MYMISIEGPDGVGKSTQVELLKSNLESKGYKVYSEHFPRYDTSLGKLIKDMLIGEKEMISFDSFQMLYIADQIDFKNKIIKLKEEKYDYLILDRYDLSTIVYYCSKNSFKSIETIFSWQKHIIKPDLTIVMISSTDINSKSNFKELDLLERDIELMKNVKHGYLYCYELLKSKRNIEIVYCDEGIEKVAEKMQMIIRKII